MNDIFSFFSVVEEHRKSNHLLYPIDYLLLVTFLSSMSGYRSWYGIETYAETHAKDLQKLYRKLTGRYLKSYTPSHDALNAAFQSMDPRVFQDTFKEWLSAIFTLAGKSIHIDGKTMRGVKKIDPDAECHTVSAYLSSIRLSIDQVFISKKSNEINAIKELLKLIDIEGSTITIDAIGTQVDIVKQIVEQKGDYILTVKENQKGTLFEVKEFFKGSRYKKEIITTNGEVEAGHGRVETRTLKTIIEPMEYKDIECPLRTQRWEGMHSIHQLTRTRCDKKTGEETIEETYLISSLTDPNKVLETIRSHWSVENNLHYCLDVLIGEDKSTKRKENSAKNFNILSKIVLFFIERMRAINKKALVRQFQINATKTPQEILAFDY